MTTKTIQIQRARTSDDKTLILWSDGQLTGAFQNIRGIGKPRDTEAALRAARMVMGDASLYDMNEIAELFKCARKAKDLADMRALFAKSEARVSG